MASPQRKPAVSLKEIGDLFDRALQIPKEFRLEFVKHVSEGNDAVENELLSLLQAHDASSEFLSSVPSPAVEDAIRHKDEQLSSDPGASQPVAFGNYKLLRKLGVGGMAEIFHAIINGESGFEKHIAIKRIIPSLTSEPALRELFEQEARITSALNHSNIAHVFDFFRVDDNYFLSMEFVRGKNLRQVMEKLETDRMPHALVLHIIAESAKGLSYAHTLRSGAHGIPLGIIHRDISPKNIMCSYDGEIKLVDFGIAKIREQLLAETRSVSLKGTFKYMSPEQALGKKVDHRSDIFSLGLVFYELLSGKSLFQATDLMQALDEVRGYPGPHGYLSAESFSDELNHLLEKALAVDPEDRYPTAEDFHRELRLLLAKDPSVSGYTELRAWMRFLFKLEIEAEVLETSEAMKKAQVATEETFTAITRSHAEVEKAPPPLFQEIRLETVPRKGPAGKTFKGSVFSARDAWKTESPASPTSYRMTNGSWGLVFLFAVAATGGALWLSRPQAPPDMDVTSEPIMVPVPSLRPLPIQVRKAEPTVVPEVLRPSASATPRPAATAKPVKSAIVKIPPVELYAPENGQQFFEGQESSGITFSWADRRDAKEKGHVYRLELSKDESFRETLFTTTTKMTQVAAPRTLPPGDVHWRVLVIDTVGRTVEVTKAFLFKYHPAPPRLPPKSRVKIESADDGTGGTRK